MPDVEVCVLAGAAEAARVLVSGERQITVFSVPTGYPGVVHLVSDTPFTDGAWQNILRRVRRMSSGLSPVLLDQADFISIAEGLSEVGPVEVSRMTARFRDDGSSITRGWKHSAKSMRPSPAEAYAELLGRGTPRTMTLHVEDVLSIHLRREAGATLYSGPMSDFQRLVLDRLARSASDRRQLLRGRTRIKGEAVRPVGVNFDSPVFSTVESLSGVLEALASMPSIGLAILHRNPYLHVVATSYVDGSSYDVMVTKDNEVTVYPGFRASMTSLSSIVQRLVEAFGASEVSEGAKKSRPTMDELFSTAV
jgi:hypothetical protein